LGAGIRKRTRSSLNSFFEHTKTQAQNLTSNKIKTLGSSCSWHPAVYSPECVVLQTANILEGEPHGTD
jgi:hypothetical protein